MVRLRCQSLGYKITAQDTRQSSITKIMSVILNRIDSALIIRAKFRIGRLYDQYKIFLSIPDFAWTYSESWTYIISKIARDPSPNQEKCDTIYP